MESSKDTNCQAPEGPILCVNNCGFFGSATTMNMCSKCHKQMITQQEQAKLAMSSIDNIVNGGSCSRTGNDPAVISSEGPPIFAERKVDVEAPTEVQPWSFCFGGTPGVPPKEGLRRCTTCRKRVGLTGFNCRCGNIFCASHRYSDEHDCPFDYQTAGRDAIARANPVVKAEKLEKI